MGGGKKIKLFCNFIKCFKGFTDAEDCLQITKERFREFFKFRFSIGLHIDDIVVLEYIKSNL